MGVGGATGYLSSFSSSFSPAGGMARRMSVPVRPAHAVFAQYRHVSGIPASLGQKSVPLSRLQILDSLLSNLRQMGVGRSDTSKSRFDSVALDENQADTLVQQYASSLHQAVSAAPLSFGALGGSASAGMVFSVTA